MNRDYADGTAQNIQFFTGIEVEHTAAYGMETLFVTGLHNAAMILAMAEENKVRHVYLGANQSFRPMDKGQMVMWAAMVNPLLKAGYWVTLDFDIHYAEWILEEGFNEKRKFISMISAKLPYLTQFNYNATLKIDDKDFEATNPGVWTHRLHDLLDSKVFTDWDQYKDDEIKQ